MHLRRKIRIPSQGFVEKILDGLRDIPQRARFAAPVAQPFIEPMRGFEPRIRPEDHPPCAGCPCQRLDMQREALREPPAPLVGPHIKPVQFANRRAIRRRKRKIERDTGADAAALILDDEKRAAEQPAIAPAPLLPVAGLHEIGQVPMRIGVAAGVLRKAEREQAEKILRIVIAGGTQCVIPLLFLLQPNADRLAKRIPLYPQSRQEILTADL
jgi:hypothetical protein